VLVFLRVIRGRGNQFGIDCAPLIRNYSERVTAFAVLCHALLDLREYSVDRLDTVAAALQPSVLPLITEATQESDASMRSEIAQAIGYFNDVRLREQDRWVEVAAGSYLRMSADLRTKPIRVPTFRMQRWLVTTDEYARFVGDRGYQDSRWWDTEGWEWIRADGINAPEFWDAQLERSPNFSVTGVSWWEASAYCRWYASRCDLPKGWTIRLPALVEWEKAARGGEVFADGGPNPDPAREYPWVNALVEGRANYGDANWIGSPTPVGIYPSGHGPYGHWDLVGNVWEWCSDWFVPETMWRDSTLGSSAVDESLAPRFATRNYRGERVMARCKATKGGAWNTDAEQLRISATNRTEPSQRHDDHGFRCVAGEVPQPSAIDRSGSTRL
jgi:formylglycine-generating enzyme required for sulfatase activity